MRDTNSPAAQYARMLPLRRVVKVSQHGAGGVDETYECGHVNFVYFGGYAYHQPKRRRCWRCKMAEEGATG